MCKKHKITRAHSAKINNCPGDRPLTGGGEIFEPFSRFVRPQMLIIHILGIIIHTSINQSRLYELYRLFSAFKRIKYNRRNIVSIHNQVYYNETENSLDLKSG